MLPVSITDARYAVVPMLTSANTVFAVSASESLHTRVRFPVLRKPAGNLTQGSILRQEAILKIA